MSARIRLISATTTAALAAVLAPASMAAETSEFTISNITDFHGYWEETKRVPGAAHLKCAVDEAAAGKTHIFTSAGDNIGASPFASKLLNDAPTLEILNLMNLQVSALGNHELDEGAEEFSTNVTKAANFDYLAANAETVKNTKDYVVKDLDGAKVAFVGTVTDDMPNLVNPKSIEGITWNNPVETTNTLAEKLKKDGEADVVVALVHEGGIKANEFSDAVDVAFLGHSHQVIAPAGEKPLLIQAGFYGNNLANVDFSFDRTSKKLTVKNAEFLDADAIRACDTPQPEIDAVVKDALEKAGAEGKKVIGRADADMYKAGDKESQLNNYIAEATRQGVSKNSSVTADIGVMNAGGVRAEIEAGDVTYEQAFSVQPFGGENTYVELKGSDVVAALEEQWRDDPERPMFPLGISDNVSYTYDPEAPVGSKITSVTVDGAPIDPERTYVVAGSTFLLGGGDNFKAFTRGTAPANLGYVDLNAFVEALGGGQAQRRSQSNVGVHLPAPLKAGEEATIELSSLLFDQGETATTATAMLGDAKASAPISPDNEGLTANEYGTATVKLTVPAGLSGAQELRITTDAGTEVAVPVEVAPATDQAQPDKREPSKPEPNKPEPNKPAPAAPAAENGSSSQDLGWIIPVAIAGAFGLANLVALLFPFAVDRVLGPIAKR
ncbi:bifunctional metallophosphatase/5'-nucleotidase [Corynebacterium fournieri]|uniref:bifunctional metallophosphatase/5'-nucleotidase n=1 Tax=Corynebacterium fournieri TaxID=1852390 RepID=UPI0025B5DBC0|nr:bifunctional UDP-sugar hydrolase/5'-nucleotidase [Corynebacterium fournieri]WJY97250.1 Endonuclease YhcR precursor [Corynebacterium fournieri]